MTNLPEKTARELKPVARLQVALSSDTVKEQFQNAMEKGSSLFVASIIDLYASDSYLQQCEPGLVISEALKAATLKLPINKNLGFAWIVPFYNGKLRKLVPQFQIGWKGIIQLAQRTGQYKYINCGPVYDGELKEVDKLSGSIDISGDAVSEKIIGYFAYIETVSGFKKSAYWPKEKVEAHAIKYSQESKKAGALKGNWRDHFDSRAMSTVLKHLVKNYGIMSIETVQVYESGGTEQDLLTIPEVNKKMIDVTPSEEKKENQSEEMTEAEKQAIAEKEAAENQEPDYS